MPQRTRQNGFTLIELMVVVAILGLLAVIVTPNLIGSKRQAELQKARMDVTQIYDAAVSFRLDHNRWPRSLEELIAGRPPKIQGFKGVPRDPWGKPYVIEPGEEYYDWAVKSLGPDGVDGGDDDIKSNVKDG